MPNHSSTLDTVFQALANSTRREIVERLGRGPATMSELAAPFDMALPSLLQHLRVLEESGMINSAKQGRVRTYQLDASALIAAEHWMEARRSEWESRLNQLDAFLLELKHKTD